MAIAAVTLVTGVGVGEASAASNGSGRVAGNAGWPTATAAGAPELAALGGPRPQKRPLEPHSWNLWCRDIYGSVYYVGNPADCSRGNVKFISTYSGKVDATMDVGTLYYKINRSYTLNDAYNDCARNLICGIVVVSGVGGYVNGKLKLAWLAIRKLKGIFGAPEATMVTSRQLAPAPMIGRDAHARI